MSREGGNPYYSSWNLMASTPVAAGPHVVSIELSSIDQTCAIDAVDYLRARRWMVGR
jgi:hypothetical protein